MEPHSPDISDRRPLRRQGSRAGFVALLLILTLGLAILLAVQAYDAARSHRAAAESALRDYTAFAAWDFAGRLKQELDYAVFSRDLKPFYHAGLGSPEAIETPPAELVRRAAEKAGWTTPCVARVYFAFDRRSHRLWTAGGVPSRALRHWIAGAVDAHAEGYDPKWDYAAFTGESSGAGAGGLVAYTLPLGAEGERPVAYGFFGDLAGIREIAAVPFEKAPLLPVSLTDGLPNDSLVSVVVTDAAGVEVYRSPLQYESTVVAEDTLPPSMGSFRVRLALRPEAAGTLIIGGLPKSKLPILGVLLLLTFGLVAAAVYQLRREHQLARLRSEFISNVSHELRTPLAQIRMFGETLLLDRVRSEDERARSLRIIDQEARRLTHLVENVLHFSRAERRLIRIEPRPTAVAPLVREAIEGFAPLAAARAARIEVELDAAAQADVDQGAFRQILLNLLDNAVKYGPPGQTVRVALTRSAVEVRIRVDDEGPGIPPSDRSRVCEPYWRLEREWEAAIAGTGIGLAVVRELVIGHGGRLAIDEAPGGGARFMVILPASPAAGNGDGGGAAEPPVLARAATNGKA